MKFGSAYGLETATGTRLPGEYYPKWRQDRIHAILDHYPNDFFRGKTLLEVGCGDGSIGNFFYYLGAKVVCSDARKDYLDEIQWRNHCISVVECDLEEAWPLPDEHFDVVLHLGTLYHLWNVGFSLEQAASHCDHLILDCEVLAYDNDSPPGAFPEVAPTKLDGEGDDHAYSGDGSRPTAAFIERILIESGMQVEMLTTDAYDDPAQPHALGWNGRSGYTNGQRRLWFCKR